MRCLHQILGIYHLIIAQQNSHSCTSIVNMLVKKLKNMYKSKVKYNVDSKQHNTLKVCCNDMAFKKCRNCVILDKITVITMVEE